MRVRQFRNKTELPPIIEDNNYDFNFQNSKIIQGPNNSAVHILPGDFLIMECETNTMDRDKFTTGGESTGEEMCFGFLTIVPRAEMVACVSRPLPGIVAHSAGLKHRPSFSLEATDKINLRRLNEMDFTNDTLADQFEMGMLKGKHICGCVDKHVYDIIDMQTVIIISKCVHNFTVHFQSTFSHYKKREIDEHDEDDNELCGN